MSFRLKTIFGIVIIEAVLLVILIWAGLAHMHDSNKEEFTRRAAITVTLFETIAKEAVLTTDIASLESIGQEMLNNPGLSYVRVLGTDNIVLSESGNPELLKRPFSIDQDVDDAHDGIFDTYKDIRVGNIKYGRVELGMSVHELYDVLDVAKHRSIAIGTIEMLLVVILSYFLGTYLTRQLASLKQASGKIENGHLGYQVHVNGKDELSQVAIAFNKMSCSLRDLNDELEDRVNNRTKELLVVQQQLETDIEKRKEIEIALQKEKQQQQELIDRLEEAHNQLLQSEKMASIGQLAAGVAHEINNPVGYINSNLGTLEEYQQDMQHVLSVYESAESMLDADSDILKKINEAKESVNLEHLKKDVIDLLKESQEGVMRVKQIVQDLKDFSHIGEVEWQWSDIHHGLDSTLNIVNNELKYKAEVIKEYGELPKVECLASQLNQVFMNLLVNAAQSIQAHGTITIRTGTKNDYIWIEISDTGKGMEPEQLQRIFDPFYTTKPVGMGTGLGLSLSYSIIKTHEGRIEVESEDGKGTTFRVWLPIHQHKNEEEQNAGDSSEYAEAYNG